VIWADQDQLVNAWAASLVASATNRLDRPERCRPRSFGMMQKAQSVVAALRPPQVGRTPRGGGGSGARCRRPRKVAGRFTRLTRSRSSTRSSTSRCCCKSPVPTIALASGNDSKHPPGMLGGKPAMDHFSLALFGQARPKVRTDSFPGLLDETAGCSHRPKQRAARFSSR